MAIIVSLHAYHSSLLFVVLKACVDYVATQYDNDTAVIVNSMLEGIKCTESTGIWLLTNFSATPLFDYLAALSPTLFFLTFYPLL